jgi:hypothetical protein
MREPLRLDRMEIEEAGPNPERIAAAIHTQLSHPGGAVPIEAIASALDIVEIRSAAAKGFVGALVMGPDRSLGSIAVEAGSSGPRRRFTIAHELGHFVNLWHKPTDGALGFACSASDLGGAWQARSGVDRHLRQEAEANRFAIELLAPARLVAPKLRGIPDLEKVVRLAAELDLSKEACARRYCELHENPTAVVFSKAGVVRYCGRHDQFPFVQLSNGDRLPAIAKAAEESGLSAHEGADPRDWLRGSCQGDLVVQTLHQQGGFAITLLALDRNGMPDEDE